MMDTLYQMCYHVQEYIRDKSVQPHLPPDNDSLQKRRSKNVTRGHGNDIIILT